MASERARKRADSILTNSFVEHTDECQHAMWDEPGCTCGREELRDEIAAALDEAQERGAQRERWECREVAWRCACERAAQLSAMSAAGNADAVAGKSAEAGRIADAIAARGPMLGPEEESRG